jgi:ABC-type phosphate transport system substrate-binding protein
MKKMRHIGVATVVVTILLAAGFSQSAIVLVDGTGPDYVSDGSLENQTTIAGSSFSPPWYNLSSANSANVVWPHKAHKRYVFWRRREQLCWRRYTE